MSIIALVICGFWLIIGFGASGSSKTDSKDSKPTTSIATSEPQAATADQEANAETEKVEEQPVVSQMSREEFVASCEEIPYKTLARNPEDYVGSHIKLTVKVSQIVQGGLFDDGEYYRVYTNDDSNMWFGDEYFMYDFRPTKDIRILQDDILTVYAECSGTTTIERALTGTKEDVVSIKAFYIDLLEDDNVSTEFVTTESDSSTDDGLTIGQKSALASANSYWNYTAFSYQGLINQLEYEKYSHEDAVFAADNCGADWNEQAAKSAKSYLNYTSFSRDGLIEQLEYEGFTHEQAVYGAEANISYAEWKQRTERAAILGLCSNTESVTL